MTPELQRWRKWLRPAFQVASIQLLVQLINALTGFLIVRSLAKTEYAWFTIINTTVAILSTAGDSGLSSGLLATGGKVWHDRLRFSRLITTALRLRMLIVCIAALGAAPWALWMLAQNSAPIEMSILLIAASFAGSITVAETVVLGIAPRLRSEVHVQQSADLIGACLRLVLSGLVLLVLPVTLLLTIVVSLGQWSQLLFMRSQVSKALDLKAPPSGEFRAELLKAVRSLWFPTLFSCVQALAGPLLLSLFGSTESVANLGALSRFSVAFSVGLSLIHHLVAPAFARSQTPRALGGLVFRGGIIVLGCCGALTFAAWLFPNAFLWLIGPSYAGLHRELVLLFLNQGMAAVVFYLWTLISARGWVGFSWITPPVTLLAQVCLLKVIEVSSLSGTLWFMIGSQVPPMLILCWMAWRGVKTWARHDLLPS